MEFIEGEQVEVIMEGEGFKGSYYAAIIISKEGTSLYKVEFTSLLNDDGSGLLEDVIDVDQLRPVPSPMPVIDFDVYDLVDAYEQDGWWGGIVYKKLELDYLIYFPTLENSQAYPLKKLRIHQEWANGGWTCTKMANKRFVEEQPKREYEEFQKKQAKNNSKGKRVQIDFEGGTDKIFKEKQANNSFQGKREEKKTPSLPEPEVTEFQAGDDVEVMLEEEGFEGSYFAAKILSKEGESQYKVEYKTLLKDDESGPLEDVVGVDQLRPSPPHFPVSCFSLYELADVYQNDGWWVGIIKRKFQSDYFVYFPTTQEEIPYPLEQLRIHQDWSDGQWLSFKSRRQEPIIPEPER